MATLPLDDDDSYHVHVTLGRTAKPVAFMLRTCDVVALEVERIICEKATMLPAEYHRPAEKDTPDRFSRHYAAIAVAAPN